MKLKIGIIYTLIIYFLIAASCSNDNSKKEARKLMEKQLALKSQEEEEVTGKKDYVTDSLLKEKNQLKEKQDKIKQNLELLNDEEEVITGNLRKRKQLELKKDIEDLEKQIIQVENELANLKQHDHHFGDSGGTIRQNQDLNTNKESSTIETIDEGIKNLDAQDEKFLKDSLVKKQRMDILQQKITLAQRNIDLLEDEKNLYLKQRNEFLKTTNDDSVEYYIKKMDELNDELKEEQDKIDKTEREIAAIKSWFGVTNNERKILNKEKSEEPQRGNAKEFIIDETERLNKEIDLLDKELDKLKTLQNQLNKKKDDTSGNLENLDKKLILEQVEKDIIIDNKGGDTLATLKSSDKKNKDLEALKSLEDEIISKKEQIDSLREEVISQAKILEQRQKKIKVRDKKEVSRVTKIITVIIAIAMVLFIILYLVGKRGNSKNS